MQVRFERERERKEGERWDYDGGSSSGAPEGAFIAGGVTEASAVEPGASALDGGVSLGALDVGTEVS